LYMSSPSAPPSTATSSSLSRPDSVSTMEYLQNNGHGHHHRGSASSGGSVGRSDSQLEPNSSTNLSKAANAASDTNSTIGTRSTSPGSASGAKDAANGSQAAGGVGEQGRNSSKRAAQNRAAQRAFRQRKELYVRELERKAELLQAAESQLITLTARNRELEAMFAAQQLQGSSASSPLPSPLPQQDGSLSRGERDWDREREWTRERAFESNGLYDHFHSPSSSIRPTLGRHSSVQHLRQAYNASSPPLSNGSIKHLSLNGKIPSPFHRSQRPDSDDEVEVQGRPHRHLHRHPSESSLNLSRTGSYPFPPQLPIEGKEEGSPRIHSFRGTADSRVEMSSPSSSNRSPLPGPHDSSMHHYPSSPLSPTHERMSLYNSNSNARSSGASAGTHTSPNAGHGETAFPSQAPSSSSSSSAAASGGPSSLSTYDLSKKRPSDGTVNWTGSDLYRNAQDAHPHPYHHAVKKQSSWSSLSERRMQTIRKQPSWGSISEYRHHWHTKTDSPEMSMTDSRFGGSAPALPQIPPQFSQQQQQQQQQPATAPQQQQQPPLPPSSTPQQQQRPPLSQQQRSFDREYPSSPVSFAYSPTGSHTHPPPQQQSQQHARQSSDYYGHASRVPHDSGHGPSDMDVVQEGSPTGMNGNSSNGSSSSNGNGYGNGSYGRQGGYDSDHYGAE
ncbi:hypothetical protein BGZ98_004372, partial [Dissophora globulifera]